MMKAIEKKNLIWIYYTKWNVCWKMIEILEDIKQKPSWEVGFL